MGLEKVEGRQVMLMRALFFVLSIFLFGCEADVSDKTDDIDENENEDEDLDVDEEAFNTESEIIESERLPFAEAPHVDEYTIGLFYRSYQLEEDDRDKRPVAILLPGGGFTNLQFDDLRGWRDALVRAGFVVFVQEYRLSSFIHLNSIEGYVGAIVDAIHDHKAFIRYLRAHEDDYDIDASSLITGGHSAGAITALHNAYLDPADVQASFFLNNVVEAKGGLEGEIGGLEGATSVDGVINLAGAINDPTTIDADEPWLLSIHGLADPIVQHDELVLGGVPVLYGSTQIAERADAVNLTHLYIDVDDGDHWAPITCEMCQERGLDFVLSQIN